MRYGKIESTTVIAGGVSLNDLTLTSDTTINFDNSMTGTEIQALIDAQPKVSNGASITFQFADGTYSIDISRIRFKGFRCPINIFGNSSDNSASTTKNTKLISSAGIFTFTDCTHVNLRYLQIQTSLCGSSSSLVYASACNYIDVQYCSLIFGDAVGGYLLYIIGGFGNISNNYFTYGYYGLYVKNSSIASVTNYSSANKPAYGICAQQAGFIAKVGVQPSGSISDESALDGGLIR